MVYFDAELYLRLLGERQLLDGDPQHHRSPLDGPAAALVAAGAIMPAAAQRVIADYTSAMSVRGDERGFPHFPPPGRRRRPGRLPRPRTVILDHELAAGSGRLLLRDLAITEDGGTLRFHWQRGGPGSGGRGHMMGRPGGFPWGSVAPVICDDRGNRPTVKSGGGGGSDDQWDGTLELRGTLAPDTAWLEVDGTQIMVDRRTASYEVVVEPLADESPVGRFLWRRLAVAQMPFGRTDQLEPALDALIAAGALEPDGPLIGELRAVAAQMPDHWGHPGRSSGAGSRGLLEPWRSLLRRYGQDDGPSRTLLVGALTPQFDGIQVAVHSVSSDPQGFETEFAVSPNVLHAHALGELPVAWWARDDRGGHYLGHPTNWGGDADRASGTMRYWPALDPRAARLELLPSADTHRAVISVSLASPAEAGA